ncbi:MAG: hypothetical protein V4858_06740 [Pseudomonadota bacterium]
MEYAIGLLLSLACVGLGTMTGMARQRVFYPMLVAAITSYYVLFAAMGASTQAIWLESAVAAAFLLLAVLGFKTSLWLVVAALLGHGLMDSVHQHIVDNPMVPPWWPGFCLVFDGVAGGCLALLLVRRSGPDACLPRGEVQVLPKPGCLKNPN